MREEEKKEDGGGNEGVNAGSMWEVELRRTVEVGGEFGEREGDERRGVHERERERKMGVVLKRGENGSRKKVGKESSVGKGVQWGRGKMCRNRMCMG